MPTEMHGREQHSLAGLEPAKVFANLNNFAGNIAAEDVRRLDAGQSLAHPHIQMVQRARPYPQQHLIFTRLGIGNIFINQNFWPTKLMNADCLHRSFSG